MSVSIQLPQNLEESLRRQVGDLDQMAKESLLVELYRQDKITRHELATALGIDRFAADELLSRHQVVEDLPTLSEVEIQARELEARLGG